MRLRKMLQQVSEVTLVRPGDALIFRVPSNVTAERAQSLHAALESRLPDVEIIVVSGVESIDVLRKVAQ